MHGHTSQLDTVCTYEAAVRKLRAPTHSVSSTYLFLLINKAHGETLFEKGDLAPSPTRGEVAACGRERERKRTGPARLRLPLPLTANCS